MGFSGEEDRVGVGFECSEEVLDGGDGGAEGEGVEGLIC